MLLLAVVFANNAPLPRAVFDPPVVFDCSADKPKALLSSPLLPYSALCPTAALLVPVVLATKAA